MTEPSLVFVTGAIRSGTTLLTRLMAASVSTEPMPQPLPLLLVRLKAEFLKQNKAPDWHVKYPLSDDVFATSFDQNAFTRFIREYPIESEKALKWLRSDQSYSGVMSEPKDGFARLESWSRSGLLDFLFEYLVSPSDGLRPTIWKEVFAESYLPYLIESEIPSAIIIRDPRDVVLSQSAGLATDYVGAVRPLLYQVRQWRKSVAWALWLEDQVGGGVVRFEDLVYAPEASLARLIGSLKLKQLRSKRMMELRPGSNSSFGSFSQIDSSTVGRFKTHLDDKTVRFIEAACLPEMRYLGYKSDMSDSEALETLGNLYIDQNPIRVDLETYQFGPIRRSEELRRLRGLLQRSSEFDPTVHITLQAYEKLRG